MILRLWEAMVCVRKILWFVVVLWAVVLGLAGAEETAAKYRWPLDVYNGYSSAFQEFRSNHFHAGIDLRTFRKTGYPVYAIADGHIYKIRQVKRGSGKGVFIRHRDGSHANFFHLDRFSKSVEEIAGKVQQYRGKKYFGNFFLPNPIGVKRGDLIGYSGETGSGFPHLHMEIRDSDYRAVNPFPLLEWPGQDRNHPVLYGLLLRNRGDSLINGRVGETLIPFKKSTDRSHTYEAKKPLVAVGSFDMVLDARDTADTGKRVSLYEISASIDGTPYFNTRFDRFAWEDNNQLGFVYDMAYSGSSRYFYNLFFQAGFLLENFQLSLSELLESLEPGAHQLKIEVKDHLNNVSSGLVRWYKMARPRMAVSAIRQEDDRLLLAVDRLSAPDCDGIDIVVYDRDNHRLYSGQLKDPEIPQRRELILSGVSRRGAGVDFNFLKAGVVYYRQRFILNDEENRLTDIKDIPIDVFINREDVFVEVKDFDWPAEYIGLEIMSAGEPQLLAPHYTKESLFFCFTPPVATAGDLVLSFTVSGPGAEGVKIQKYLKLIRLQDGSRSLFRWGEFEAEFHTHSVREPRVLCAEERHFDSDFPVLSPQISLYPYHFPFLDLVYYKFSKKVENPRQVGIFKYDFRHKRWGYVHTVFEDRTDTFKTKVISSGTFALMRDVFPPVIRLNRLRTQYLKNLKRLVVRISDKGKGIDYRSLRITLNGKPLACEYDYDWRHVVIENLRYRKTGENILTVRIKDYGGNRAFRSFKFYLK
jgi:hypothetical protein